MYGNFIATWQTGQTYVVRVRNAKTRFHDDKKDKYGAQYVLTVTNDGETWAAFAGPMEFEDDTGIDVPQPEGKPIFRGTMVRLEPEFRLPLEWAKKAVVEPFTLYSTQAAKLLKTETIPYESPATKDLGSVTYTGFEKYKKRSAHSLSSIHHAVNASVLQARKAWGWECRGLEIKFHDHGKTMGLAYMAGTGAKNGVRKISLAVELIEQYDLNSIARTMLHELCHHYREEKWPRGDDEESHDVVFCRALAEADSEAKDARTCTFVTDAKDPALVTIRKERLAARITEPVWSPDAGEMEFYSVKAGGFRLAWVPRPGFKWSPWMRRVNNASLIEILKHFAYLDWNSVAVKKVDQRLSKYSDSYTLAELVVSLVKMYPRELSKAQAFIKEMLEANR